MTETIPEDLMRAARADFRDTPEFFALRTASYHAAHDFVSRNYDHLKSDICRRPGLAEIFADFAIEIAMNALMSERSRQEERVRVLEEALTWYGEQARLARLVHSEGDKGRHALSGDGGKRARAALGNGGGDA
jgi:hypothetical protein